MTFHTVDIVLSESVTGPELIKKLTPDARRLFYYMSLAYRRNRYHLFSSEEMVAWSGFEDRHYLTDCLYELESRSFGRVRRDGTAVFFDASAPLLASVEFDPEA